ncbi:hypothetical protein V492_07031 [Pseudogymnoascus sp. VKM F-4246]|nr:hypothetical protein V492_07031 [Pseudogymnoascus sp. VKM F-4246]
MSESEWIEKEIAELVAEHGTVPPPYLKYPDMHPFSIFWRMGSGESYMMVFWGWWEQNAEMDERKRIEYIQKFPPPPLWLTWAIHLIWYPDDEEMEMDPEETDYSISFERTEALGLGTEEECKRAWALDNERVEAEIKARDEK